MHHRKEQEENTTVRIYGIIIIYVNKGYFWFDLLDILSWGFLW